MNRRSRDGHLKIDVDQVLHSESFPRVYGGSEPQARGDATAVPLGNLGALLADLDTLPPAPAPGVDPEA